MPGNKKMNKSGKTKTMKREERRQSSLDSALPLEASVMGVFKECVDKLVIEVINRTLSSRKIMGYGQELLRFMEICDKDTSKLFMFNDKEDVESIQHLQSLLGHEPRRCDSMFIWSSLVYRLVPEDKDKTLKEWTFLFSKQRSTECSVCLEKIKRSADKTTCHKCHDTRCRICDLQQDLQCPVCREFDLEAYCRNRTIYLNQILMQAGKKACEETAKEKFPCDSVDDLVDQATRVCGEKVYDVRDQCKPMF